MRDNAGSVKVLTFRCLPMVAILAVTAAGCGSSSSGRGRQAEGPAATTAYPPQADARAVAWVGTVRTWADELQSTVPALAVAASSADPGAGLSVLGPLSRCRDDLAAIGSAPAGYDLSYGSFQAACESFESGADLYRAGVKDGYSLPSALYQIRRGSELINRGLARLSAPTEGKPQGRGDLVATREWASKVDQQIRDMDWAIDAMNRATRISDNPVRELWAEHSGGAVAHFADCDSDIRRAGGRPPTGAAREILDHLIITCHGLQSAVNDFKAVAYSRGRGEAREQYLTALKSFRLVIDDLRVYAP